MELKKPVAAVRKDAITLPAPRWSGTVPLEQVIYERRSIREYTREPIALEDLAQLLWAAQGITSSAGFRTTPSAFSVYPLEVYAAIEHVDGIAPGLYHYIPAPGFKEHRLELVHSPGVGKVLYELTSKQEFITDVAVNIVLAVVIERMQEKAGDVSAQLCFLELGHCAQNIHLQAQALELGSVAIGYLQGREIQKKFRLEGEPQYMVSVGRMQKGTA